MFSDFETNILQSSDDENTEEEDSDDSQEEEDLTEEDMMQMLQSGEIKLNIDRSVFRGMFYEFIASWYCITVTSWHASIIVVISYSVIQAFF